MQKTETSSKRHEHDKEVNPMPYYHTCPQCGAALDPGEHCDCDKAKKQIEAAKVSCDYILDCRPDPVETFALSY